MEEVLRYLKKYGQSMDTDIAAAIKVPLPQVRRDIGELTASGQIMACKVIRYVKGTPHEGIECRVSGMPPVSSPGRKPGTQSAASYHE